MRSLAQTAPLSRSRVTSGPELAFRTSSLFGPKREGYLRLFLPSLVVSVDMTKSKTAGTTKVARCGVYYPKRSG